MKRLTNGLSIAIVTMGLAAGSMAAFAQTNPNAPTGPNNPNEPPQLTGARAPMPCGADAKAASNGKPATPPAASPGKPQESQADAANGKSSTSAGCTAPDHPAGATTPAPAPAGAPHP
ncbi:MAG TPA: hypothetical protein VG328_00155 [Stellaceae bacterium]|nr:hypothetical protein [Stellaceae bacterium]